MLKIIIRQKPLLDEAAQFDLPNHELRITQEDELVFIDLINSAGRPAGGMTISKGFMGDNIWNITGVAAPKGFGPVLYELAIEFAQNNGGLGLTPDPVSISEDAQKVWFHYLTKRKEDIKTLPLPKTARFITPRPNELKQIFRLRHPGLIQKLLAANKIDDPQELLKSQLSETKLSPEEEGQLGTKKKTYDYVSKEDYANKLRPYLVSRSKKRNPALDDQLTAYTPGETLELIMNSPKIKEWFEKMRNFKIPEGYGTVILVSCAATKPWGMSCNKGDFYPYYNKIRQDVRDGKIKPVYFVTISEPLGAVPEDFWGDDPAKLFPQYDNPGLFNDTVLQSGMMTKDWEKSPLGQKREMPFGKESFDKAIQILGTELGNFLRNNSAHNFVSFVEQADGTKSTHSRMLDIAEKVSGTPIERNPKKPGVGRQAVNKDVGSYMRNKLNL
jgi:hypothetical protein